MTPPGLRIRYAVCALAGLPFLNLSCSAPRRQPDRIRSNEKSFILRLKIIKTACDTYQIAYGSFPRSRPDPLPTSCGRLGGDVLRPHAPALPSPRPARLEPHPCARASAKLHQNCAKMGGYTFRSRYLLSQLRIDLPMAAA